VTITHIYSIVWSSIRLQQIFSGFIAIWVRNSISDALDMVFIQNVFEDILITGEVVSQIDVSLFIFSDILFTLVFDFEVIYLYSLSFSFL